jgi:hypothetical protein
VQLWRVEGPSDLSVAVAVLPESGPEKLQFTMQAVLVTKGSGHVCQRGEYGLFDTRMVVRVGVEAEVRVSGFAVNLMAQGTIRITAGVNIKDGKVAVPLGLIVN